MDDDFKPLIDGLNLRTVHRVTLADDPRPGGRRDVLIFFYGDPNPHRITLTEDRAYAMSEQLSVAVNAAKMSAAPVVDTSAD